MTYHDDYISDFTIDLFNSISISFVHLIKFQTVYFILRKREGFSVRITRYEYFEIRRNYSKIVRRTKLY